MALQATVSKGGLTIENGYILVVGIRIDHATRPTTDDQGNFAGNVEVVASNARLVLYAGQAERKANFNSYLYTFSVDFEHVDGADPFAEAYAAFTAQANDPDDAGKQSGWSFTNITEVD